MHTLILDEQKSLAEVSIKEIPKITYLCSDYTLSKFSEITAFRCITILQENEQSLPLLFQNTADDKNTSRDLHLLLMCISFTSLLCRIFSWRVFYLKIPYADIEIVAEILMGFFWNLLPSIRCSVFCSLWWENKTWWFQQIYSNILQSFFEYTKRFDSFHCFL